MSKNKKKGSPTNPDSTASSSVEDAPVSYNSNWITDRAWISGLVGALLVVIVAIYLNQAGALKQGIVLLGHQVTDSRTDTTLYSLFFITAAMFFVETIRLWLRSPNDFFQLSPDIKSGRYLKFFSDSLFNYLSYLAILGFCILIYHSANEYGFQKVKPPLYEGGFYKSWFRFLDIIWAIYLWCGLPYVLITRAFKHDADSDKGEMSTTFQKIVVWAISRIPAPSLKEMAPTFVEKDKKVSRGFIVKLFFTPLMTVFFCDQFPHLIDNVGYLAQGLPESIARGTYTHVRFNRDFFNISIALIFSIDVALAWCGYVIASRWADSQTASAEPTMIGWLVCIMCYPPINNLMGWYYAAPGEKQVLRFENQWFTSTFTGMMVLSYIVYMSATVFFGVRFSNLTNRGIIRKGPFAFIRHPAYASKNFAWWCVMFPAVVYNASNTGLGVAAAQITGLIMMTGFYYLRAITEENHLMADPYYREYCKHVKYRFIPGVI